MTVRSALIACFLAVCGIPLLLFWFWPHAVALDTHLEDARERHLLFADGLGTSLEKYHEDVTSTFEAMAGLIDRGEDIGFAQTLLERLKFSHLCLVDPETGRILRYYTVRDMRLPDAVPPTVRTEIARLLAEPDMSLAQVFNPSGKKPMFVLAREVAHGVVFAGIRTDLVVEMADRVTFDVSGHAAIIGRDGRVIAHPDTSWRLESRDLSKSPDVRPLLEMETAGVEVFFSPKLEAEVLAGVVRVPGPGWTVLVPQPLSELRAQASAMRGSAMLVLLAGLTLAAVVAFLAAHLLSRPLREVANAAKRMAEGEAGVRLPPPMSPGLLENRTLRESFNQMAERMEEAMGRLTSLAEQDSLTGLLNKRTFLERATRRIETYHAIGTKSALFLFDVNKLKIINDVYGHEAGDQAILAVSAALKDVFGQGAVLCRAGGDEFLALCPVTGVRQATARARRVQQHMMRPAAEPGTVQPQVSCSIGAALSTREFLPLDTLLARADHAMYLAKRRGGDIKVYDARLEAWVQRWTQLATELRTDVKTNRMAAEFQPIMDAASGRLAGFETLARWRSRNDESVSPDEFISIAKEQSFVVELDRAVREHAFAFTRHLRNRGCNVPVSINVTALELARKDFAYTFMTALVRAGLHPGDIILEMTEAIFEDSHELAQPTLAELGERGVRLMLDDFGKGFASHGLLHSHRFDGLKVDMRFSGDIHANLRARSVVTSLVELGMNLGLSVVLEGVETSADLTFAKRCAVDFVQGYHFARPMCHAKAIDFAVADEPERPCLGVAGQ